MVKTFKNAWIGCYPIKKMEYNETVNILKTAAKVYSNPAYDRLAKEIDEKNYHSDFGHLTF